MVCVRLIDLRSFVSFVSVRFFRLVRVLSFGLCSFRSTSFVRVVGVRLFGLCSFGLCLFEFVRLVWFGLVCVRLVQVLSFIRVHSCSFGWFVFVRAVGLASFGPLVCVRLIDLRSLGV